MRVELKIEYFTSPSETLFVVLEKDSLPMQYRGDGNWYLYNFNIEKGEKFYFQVRNGEQIIRQEGYGHNFLIDRGLYSDSIIGYSCVWHEEKDAIYFSSSKFFSVFKPEIQHNNTSYSQYKDKIQVFYPNINPNYDLGITGSSENLGSWKRAYLLEEKEKFIYEFQFIDNQLLEYKFVLIEKSTGNLVWEIGDNRKLGFEEYAIQYMEVDSPKFEKELQKIVGTAVPLFSLRSANSFGVGDFADLKLFIDFMSNTSQNIIQLLPINNTVMSRTWEDSYPYNTNSSFALHPQYLHLQWVGDISNYEDLRKQLNSLEELDYEKVNEAKEEILRAFFNKAELSNNQEYNTFIKSNKTWLMPYAVYSSLRDEYDTLDFDRWGKLSVWNENEAQKYYTKHKKEVEYYFYEQYLLDKQLKEVIAYAHLHHIAIKGDLPIGVSRVSADIWHNPSIFNLNSYAGAPPDAFSDKGQNWGFPTYNWEEMEKSGFSWWKARLAQMSKYFDAYRIDHILGFFRIWEIPALWNKSLLGHFYPALPIVKGKLKDAGFDKAAYYLKSTSRNLKENVLFVEDNRMKGYYHPRIDAYKTTIYNKLPLCLREKYDKIYNDFFYHRHNEFWKASAMKKLPALLKSSKMLPCGEDLGMIPYCVPEVLRKLNILSLEIERMPKEFGLKFGNVYNYPKLSVASTGTHDMTTLRGWWQEDRGNTQTYYLEILQHEGNSPKSLNISLMEQILYRHLHSSSMIIIFPLQDWLALTKKYVASKPNLERINDPANSRHYWRYRMLVNIEVLIKDKKLTNRIVSLRG